MGCSALRNEILKILHVVFLGAAIVCTIINMHVDTDIVGRYKNESLKGAREGYESFKSVLKGDKESFLRGADTFTAWQALIIIAFICSTFILLWFGFGDPLKHRCALISHYCLCIAIVGIASILAILYLVHLFNMEYYDLSCLKSLPTSKDDLKNLNITALVSQNKNANASSLPSLDKLDIIDKKCLKAFLGSNGEKGMTPKRDVLGLGIFWTVLIGFGFTIITFILYIVSLLINLLKSKP